MYNCIYLSKRYFIRRFYHLKLKRKQRAFSRFLSFFVVAEQPRKQRMFDDVKMKKKEKKKILNIYRILLYFTRARVRIVEKLAEKVEKNR